MCEDDIRDKHASLGGPGGLLGAPTAPARPALTPGWWQPFDRGAIYAHPDTRPGRTGCRTHEVHGRILSIWDANGRERRRLGWPVTDESVMAHASTGRYSVFTNGVIPWTNATDGWVHMLDGRPGSAIRGSVTLWADRDRGGRSHEYVLASEQPIVDKRRLEETGLHDRAGSVESDVPDHCSVYVYEHHDLQGRWCRLTGRAYEANLDQRGLNDAVTSVMAVSHGLGSLVIPAAVLTELSAETIAREIARVDVDDRVYGLQSTVQVLPRRLLRVIARFNISKPLRDFHVTLRLDFRLLTRGERELRAHLVDWDIEVDGAAGQHIAERYAEDTFRARLEDELQQRIEESLMNELSDALAGLPAGDLGEVVHLRRINFLPGELEIVVTDDERGRRWLEDVAQRGLPFVSTRRRGGLVTHGESPG